MYKTERINTIKIGPVIETYDITNYEADLFWDEPNFFANDILVHNSVHAGGIVITDEPVYKRCPVDRVGDQIVTAFPESGGDDSLDKIGVIKLDNLSVSILDVIKSAVDLVDEKLFLIKEDGIEKIVPQSYLDKEIDKF